MMKYLKVWTNFTNTISRLEDDEIGRLFLAMLHYAETGEEPDNLPGNEFYIWPSAKRDIDMMKEFNEKQRANGIKGGRPRTKTIPEEPNKTQNNPDKPNESQKTLKENKINEKKGKEISFLSDDDAGRIQEDHNRILDAAQDAGFKSSPAERAGLLNLYAVHGLEKMISGISECVKHSAPNLAYLEAVLKGSPKKKSSATDIHGYSQRDYSNEQAEAIKRMMSDEWGEAK